MTDDRDHLPSNRTGLLIGVIVCFVCRAAVVLVGAVAGMEERRREIGELLDRVEVITRQKAQLEIEKAQLERILVASQSAVLRRDVRLIAPSSDGGRHEPGCDECMARG